MYNSINSFLTELQASSILDYCKNTLSLKEAKVSKGIVDSSILHKVTPIQFGVRYSLVTWVGLIESPHYIKKLL